MTDPWLPPPAPQLLRPVPPPFPHSPVPARRRRTWLIVLCVAGAVLLVATLAAVTAVVATDTARRPAGCAGVPAEGALKICGPLGGAYEITLPDGLAQSRDSNLREGYLATSLGGFPPYVDVYARNAHAVPADLDALSRRIRAANSKDGAKILDPVGVQVINGRRVAHWQQSVSSGDNADEWTELLAVVLVGDRGEYLKVVYSEPSAAYSRRGAEAGVGLLIHSVRPLG